MSAYKLTYFHIKGLGESIRWLFAYANVDFVDKRLNADEWKILKPMVPMKQLPLLEVDGKKIIQSVAITRYLAKRFGLAGKDDWENLEIDSVVDCMTDMRIKVVSAWYEKFAPSKVEQLKVAEETTKYCINYFDELVKANGGYLVGGRVTWADIIFMTTLETVNPRLKRDVIEKAENLKALREKIHNIPGIKVWLAQRPTSKY